MQKYTKVMILLIMLVSIVALSVNIFTNASKNQRYKKDLAELNHFKYGLFSVDAWKGQISKIIFQEIDSFYLSRKNEKVFRQHLETQLAVLIDKIYKRIIRKNLLTTEGRIKQTFLDGFIDIEDIKKGVPEYAEAILKELSSSRTESQIKGMLKEKIDDYMSKTFDVRTDKMRDRIIASYQAPNEEAAKIKLQKRITALQDIIAEQALLMICLAALIFIVEAFSKGPLIPINYFILTFTLLALLLVGVATPMIDLEAKISNLSFMLFNSPVKFEDQVLYFQSKSVLDVFWVMITHKELDMKLVGVLMVAFSVVFPLLKVVSSLAYYYDYCRARNYRIIQFFVLKSGKWSMADVLVVAMFMAFIGFNGIINSQLGDIKTATEGMDIFTTNGTNLQPGFYLFFAYTILAMFLSGFIKSRPYECSPTDEVLPSKTV